MDSTLFQFLDKLKNNNNRDWFKKNKPEFDLLNSQVKSYFQSVFDQHKYGGASHFRELKDTNYKKIYFVDEVHLSDSGNEIVSKVIGNFVKLIK